MNEPLQQPPTPSLSGLADEISGIYRQAQDRTAETLNTQLTRSYWGIGARIVREEQKGEARAAYGAELIPRLSEELRKRGLSGFSARNLHYMRRFHLEYRLRELSPRLSWTHYRILLSVKDKELRRALQDRALREKLSNTQLAYLARQGRAGRRQEPGADGWAMPRPAGELGCLRIKPRPSYIASGVLADLGFRVTRLLPPSRAARLSAGDIVRADRTARATGLTKLDPSWQDRLYAFKAHLVRVVDGDTLVVNVDLGFDTYTERPLRLRGLDAPELFTEQGERAKSFVQSQLSGCDVIAIKTYSTDKYDRYLADIFYDKKLKDPRRIFQNGNFLNQELLDAGLATPTTR